jgi:predicted nucleotidyltransferase
MTEPGWTPSVLTTVLCGRLARLVVDEYVRWADQHPRVKAIYIFGSIARGDCRPTSDVDIYVEVALCQHTAIFLLENRLSRIQAKQEPILECFCRSRGRIVTLPRSQQR